MSHSVLLDVLPDFLFLRDFRLPVYFYGLIERQWVSRRTIVIKL